MITGTIVVNINILNKIFWKMETLQYRLSLDSLVYFTNKPVRIYNDAGKEIKIYGMLFNKKEAHSFDLFSYWLNMHIAYLRLSELVQWNGGNIAVDYWEMNGNKISLKFPYKKLIYQIVKERLQKQLDYSIIETDRSLPIYGNEIDGNYLISIEPLKRLGIDYGVVKSEEEMSERNPVLKFRNRHTLKQDGRLK